MPLVGADPLLSVDGEYVRLPVHGGHGRVRLGEGAEAGGEGDLALVVEIGASEDERFVLEQRGVDRGEAGRVVQVDAGDLRADPSADLSDVEAGHDVPF